MAHQPDRRAASDADSNPMIHLSDRAKLMIRKEAGLRQGVGTVELAGLLLPELTKAVARVMERTPGVELLALDHASGATYDVPRRSALKLPA